jgi:hypothetical protein
MPLGDATQADADPTETPCLEEDRRPHAMLAEVVDAVVGGDTHRDTHTFELTAPSGATIATRMIGNDESGYAEAIAWMAERAPGPRVVVGLEGTRSHGIGLARVLQAAGLTVVEIERPRRGERPRGKPDPIDAHLAALHEASPERLRNHLRRPDADEDQLIMKPPLTRLIGQTQMTSTWSAGGAGGERCAGFAGRGHSGRDAASFLIRVEGSSPSGPTLTR